MLRSLAWLGLMLTTLIACSDASPEITRTEDAGAMGPAELDLQPESQPEPVAEPTPTVDVGVPDGADPQAEPVPNPVPEQQPEQQPEQPEPEEQVVTVQAPSGESVDIVFSGEGVECGTESCRDAEVEGITLPGCCFDGEGSVCGADLSMVGPLIGVVDAACEPINVAAEVDVACPVSEPLESAIERINGEVLLGCCQPNGQCGYLTSLEGVGFGCIAPERFGEEPNGECEPG